MKIRNGFVSNSSSSSFIIAWKGNLEEELKKAFNLDGKDYPIKDFNSEIPRTFINKIDGPNGSDIEDIIDNYGDEDSWLEDDYPSILAQWKRAGYKIGFGELHDDDDDMERFLCNSEIEWDTENLKIKSEGGY